MKLSLVSAVTFCVSFSLPALASIPQSVPLVLQAPQSTNPPSTAPSADAAAVEPAALSIQGSAADLTVEERSPSAPGGNRAETLNVTAAQINQDLANPPEQQASPLSSLGEAISLPQGMVVRGVNRGGVAIGSELPR